MNKRKTVFVIYMLMILVMVSACTGKNGSFDLTKPVSLDTNPPEGPYNYRQGWSDGCESGLSAVNDKVQLFFATHKYTLDEKLRYDVLYAKAWKYGYDHCAYSMKSMMQYKYL